MSAMHKRHRACNACDWNGVTDRMLGSIGPLCPECGETTEVIAVIPTPVVAHADDELPSDAQIIAALHANGIDTYPSKYGFDATQVSATSVPSLRNVLRTLAATPGKADAANAGRQRLKNLLIDIGSILGAFVQDGVPIERSEARPLLTRVRAARQTLSESPATSAADAKDAEPTQAARDVLAERRRQANGEGMTNDGDDRYRAAELPRAAAAYILNGANEDAPYIWPWAKAWWKPRDARANYVRAAALLLAEIERIDRAAAKGADHQGGTT